MLDVHFAIGLNATLILQSGASKPHSDIIPFDANLNIIAHLSTLPQLRWDDNMNPNVGFGAAAHCSHVSFEQLPPEILLRIVPSSYSLDVLWNLMRASPRIWSIFDSHALKITEGILSGPESILPVEIQELIRNVILVRSKVFPYRDVHEF
jgi:hypothetical protein